MTVVQKGAALEVTASFQSRFLACAKADPAASTVALRLYAGSTAAEAESAIHCP